MVKYVDQYKELHKLDDGYGNTTRGNRRIIAPAVRNLIQTTKSQTLLDFGSGKGKQYEEPKPVHINWKWGIKPTLYDPAIEEYSILPEKSFDGIISVDVLEHIPEEELPEVFNYIYTHADKFIYLAISTSLAKTILPNGENAHCTVKPIRWWVNKIHKLSPKKVTTMIQTYGDLGTNKRVIKW